MDTQDIGRNLFRHIIPINENIVRVAYSHVQEAPERSILIADNFSPDAGMMVKSYEVAKDLVAFKNKRGEAVLKETDRSLIEKLQYFNHKYRYQDNFTVKLICNGKRLNAVNVIYAGEETAVNLI